MKLDTIVEGKHKKTSFRYKNGILYMFDKEWDYSDIQKLVETANLLKLEGYVLKNPIGTEKQTIDLGLFGKHITDKKVYEDSDEEGE